MSESAATHLARSLLAAPDHIIALGLVILPSINLGMAYLTAALCLDGNQLVNFRACSLGSRAIEEAGPLSAASPAAWSVCVWSGSFRLAACKATCILRWRQSVQIEGC